MDTTLVHLTDVLISLNFLCSSTFLCIYHFCLHSCCLCCLECYTIHTHAHTRTRASIHTQTRERVHTRARTHTHTPLKHKVTYFVFEVCKVNMRMNKVIVRAFLTKKIVHASVWCKGSCVKVEEMQAFLILVSTSNKLARWGWRLSPFYSWGHWGSERFVNLSQIFQEISDEVGIEPGGLAWVS